MTPGHLGCQGCGAALAMRYVLDALGRKTIIVMPACCWSIIAGPFPYSTLRVPILHTAFETAAIGAAGVRAGLDSQGDKDTTVVAWAGDGGTFDIGLQALSGAAERNEDILYVCYDNEAYMNTGVQRSSATPLGAWTTTTPDSKQEYKKEIMQIMAAHRIPYAATASIAYPDDLIEKVKKAKEITGLKFLHIFAPCPTGWKAPSELSVHLARLAVMTRVFPLYEIEWGIHYKLDEVQDALPISEYTKFQGRFKNWGEQTLQLAQKRIDDRWSFLQSMAKFC
jgi:pyruvate ferredoxin oxidoreductase beta subunit/2-oxoisovalerate ferredoxin oxidoreductase beta subunit